VLCPSTQQANLTAVLHNIPLMLNSKQGSCEYQLFESFGLNRIDKGNEYTQTLQPLDHVPVVLTEPTTALSVGSVKHGM